MKAIQLSLDKEEKLLIKKIHLDGEKDEFQ